MPESQKTISAPYVGRRYNDPKPLLTMITDLAVFAVLFICGATAFLVALKIGAAGVRGIM
jgi:hypothetical protein